MRIKVGVMGSADDTLPADLAVVREKGVELGRVIAARGFCVLTGATTGLPYLVGKAAHEAGTLHIGISPAANLREHMTAYRLPIDNCDALIYTGFGLKGRNVVLVRSCDIVLFIGGSMGSLNEFTIAHDEGRIIGCLTGTGGVADEAAQLLQTFPKRTGAQVFHDPLAAHLLDACADALEQSRKNEAERASGSVREDGN